MATYTIRLKNLIDSGYNIGLDEYPIFDDSYRETLNNKIINHYALYEIGLETPQMFKFQLNNKLNEIMPYYNMLYLSIPKNFENNTFSDIIEYIGQTEHEQTNSGSDNNVNRGSTTRGNRTDTNKRYDFDTPQNADSINLSNPDHMSSATAGENTIGQSTDTNNSDSTITYGRVITDIEKFVNRKNVHTGYNQSVYKTLLEFRNAILNIDMMIINELRDLFMLIY